MVEIAKGKLTGISWKEQQDLVLTGMLSPVGTPFEVKLSKPVDQRLVNQIFEMLRDGDELVFHGNTTVVKNAVDKDEEVTSDITNSNSDLDQTDSDEEDNHSESDKSKKCLPDQAPVPGEHLQTVGQSDFDPKKIGESLVQRLDNGHPQPSVAINTTAEESIAYQKPSSFGPTDFEDKNDNDESQAQKTIKYDANGHEVNVNDSESGTDSVDEDPLPGL